MEKLFNRKTYIIVAILIACVCLALFMRSFLSDREVIAFVSPPQNVELGKTIRFVDKTKGADKWQWEFGNGDSSSAQSGEYKYPKEGKYQIRLIVNGRYEKRFIIQVNPPKATNLQSELIDIDCPAVAIQGEYIVFKGLGEAREWRWQFQGESSPIGSREKTALYKYDNPGDYEVWLTTDNTQYPIRRKITIEPQYSDNDSVYAENIKGNDIRQKLQAIVDQKPFNTNYNHILTHYLCNYENALVVINNDKKNDFYSYCQGLRLLGRRNKTKIKNVLIETNSDNPADSCISKLIVIQSDEE